MGTRLIREVCLFLAVLGLPLYLGLGTARAMPPAAVPLGPVLVSAQKTEWPAAPEPWTLAGLVEQESCITLQHPKCWNPRAELKTSCEYGFGLGQITVAYRPDGSERFNTFLELKAAHPSLRGWDWADRFRADFQLKSVVLTARSLWSRTAPAATTRDQWAFTLSSYNGGISHLRQDRILCSHRPGCDQQRWFGHVELDSVKARTPMPGYGGQSPFSINRKYPATVLDVRRGKYRPWWEV